MESALLVSFSFYRWSTSGLNKLYNFSKVIHAGNGSTRTSLGLCDFCGHTLNLCDVVSKYAVRYAFIHIVEIRL